MFVHVYYEYYLSSGSMEFVIERTQIPFVNQDVLHVLLCLIPMLLNVSKAVCIKPFLEDAAYQSFLVFSIVFTRLTLHPKGKYWSIRSPRIGIDTIELIDGFRIVICPQKKFADLILVQDTHELLCNGRHAFVPKPIILPHSN